jgi:hypothetical protein
MEGTTPTPSGDIRLHVSRKKITVETAGGKGILRFRSSRKPACKTGILKNVAPGLYEMELSPNQKYEIMYTCVER